MPTSTFQEQGTVYVTLVPVGSSLAARRTSLPESPRPPLCVGRLATYLRATSSSPLSQASSAWAPLDRFRWRCEKILYARLDRSSKAWVNSQDLLPFAWFLLVDFSLAIAIDDATGHAQNAKKFPTRSRKKVSGRRFKTRSVGLVEAETFFCLALCNFMGPGGKQRKHHLARKLLPKKNSTVHFLFLSISESVWHNWMFNSSTRTQRLFPATLSFTQRDL